MAGVIFNSGGPFSTGGQHKEEKPLYQDSQLKVTYLHSPEPGREKEIVNFEDHELWIKEDTGEYGRYILPRGILNELAVTSRDDLERKLRSVNHLIIYSLRKGKLNIGDIGMALSQAHLTEQKRYEDLR